MAITFGFYNSMNGDRKYDAVQISSIFDGVIRDGVFQSIGEYLATKSGTGMQVIVSPGKAWFNHTWTINDAALPLDIEQADVTLKRYDAIILEVDSTKTVRENTIKVVKGTPASDPKKPQPTNTDDFHQYALAYILVNPGVTEIKSQDIEVNVGKDDCPFVTSILESVSIEALLEKWEGEFRAWFEELQSQMEGDVATNLQNQITRNAPSIGDVTISYNLDKDGPWLKCDGRSYDTVKYSELYSKLKENCSFSSTIPLVPYMTGVIFVGEKGFFFGEDGYIYVSDSRWEGPDLSKKFKITDVLGIQKATDYGDILFSYANGSYIITVTGSYGGKILYAYSSDGHSWTKKIVTMSDSSSVQPYGFYYHAGKYTLIYVKSSYAYYSKLDTLNISSVPVGKQIGGISGDPVIHVSDDANTMYITSEDAGSSSQNWKISSSDSVTSMTLPSTSASNISTVRLTDFGGKCYKIYVWRSNNLSSSNIEFGIEGSSSYVDFIVIKTLREGAYNSINQVFDVVEEDGKLYVLFGRSICELTSSAIQLVRDDLKVKNIDFGTLDTSVQGRISTSNSDAHILSADIKEQILITSSCRQYFGYSSAIEEYLCYSNSPKATPYILSSLGPAYIRSEK